MITFKCPHCGKAVSVADEHAGKQGRCPGCKELFQIPVGGTAVVPAPAAEQRTPPAADEADADEEPRQRRAKAGRREPDEDEEDEAPRKKKRTRDEDEAIVEAPRKKRRARDDEDEDEDEFDEEADFPKVVTAAGIAWIGFGSLILVGLVILVLGTFVLAAAGPKGGPEGGAIGGMLCASLVGGLFGAAFIFVGAQSARGTARDTLGNGIGSIIFGVIYLGVAAVQAGMENILQAGIGFLAGLGLVAAGVLALIGRSQYRAWKKSQNPRRRARDRRYY